MKTEIKVGDKVRIAKDSRYYGAGSSNPTDVIGEVVDTTDDDGIVGLNIRVSWGTFTNSYNSFDLELVEDHTCSADSSNKSGGIKFDSGKPDMTDIPMEAMWEMGAAFTYGQKKYGKNNYREGMNVSRQLAAAVRHIYQHLDGQDLDPESQHMHLGHAMASIAMAIYNLKNNPQFDDRSAKDINKHKKLT